MMYESPNVFVRLIKKKSWWEMPWQRDMMMNVWDKSQILGFCFVCTFEIYFDLSRPGLVETRWHSWKFRTELTLSPIEFYDVSGQRFTDEIIHQTSRFFISSIQVNWIQTKSCHCRLMSPQYGTLKIQFSHPKKYFILNVQIISNFIHWIISSDPWWWCEKTIMCERILP